VNIDRKRLLTYNTDEPFTDHELNQGYHACPEWDGLVIGPEDPEFECCECNIVIVTEV
jgi:hypothetical protein